MSAFLSLALLTITSLSGQGGIEFDFQTNPVEASCYLDIWNNEDDHFENLITVSYSITLSGSGTFNGGEIFTGTIDKANVHFNGVWRSYDTYSINLVNEPERVINLDLPVWYDNGEIKTNYNFDYYVVNVDYYDDEIMNRGYLYDDETVIFDSYFTFGQDFLSENGYINDMFSPHVTFDLSNFYETLRNSLRNYGDNTYNAGYTSGYNYGYNQGLNVGYSNGYGDGFNDGSSTDGTITTIFNGILNVGLLPINFFLSMFNFEVLGINLTQFVASLLTIACVIIVVKIITGKKGD